MSVFTRCFWHQPWHVDIGGSHMSLIGSCLMVIEMCLIGGRFFALCISENTRQPSNNNNKQTKKKTQTKRWCLALDVSSGHPYTSSLYLLHISLFILFTLDAIIPHPYTSSLYLLSLGRTLQKPKKKKRVQGQFLPLYIAPNGSPPAPPPSVKRIRISHHFNKRKCHIVLVSQSF